MSRAVLVGDLKGEGDSEILKAADRLVTGSYFRKLALWAASEQVFPVLSFCY